VFQIAHDSFIETAIQSLECQALMCKKRCGRDIHLLTKKYEQEKEKRARTR